MTIGGLFNIGTSALNASQSNIAVTGNNIANVNTPGYSRQYVRLEEAYTLDGRPGGKGQGVNAVEVMRRFNKFLERAYLDKSSTTARWNSQYESLTSVENLFNETNRRGISSSMVSFFKGWQDLALRPDDPATRQSLLSYADNLALMYRQTTENLEEIRRQMDLSISEDVDKVNGLIKNIADLNRQIVMHTQPGVSNPNNLLDQRDMAVRKLAECVDINVIEGSNGEFTVQLKNGMTLVQGPQTFELTLQGPQAESNKAIDSPYKGEISFDGLDSHEYTVEMVNGGSVGDVPPPSFRVSLDGGKTWLRDDKGNEIHYDITDTDGDGNVDPVQVKNLKISFTSPDSADPTLATQNFNATDRFIITPKTGVYWVEPTRGPQNITPQTYFDGTENQGRLTGGTMTAAFNVRDDNCGRYLDELNALASSLIWEVNRLHSQGAGLEHMTFANGTYSVYNAGQPLGSPQSGLNYYDKLSAGNVQFNIYNKETGDFIVGGPLDFDAATPGVQNFDPAVHSMNDVANAINTTYAGQLKATVLDGKLSIQADPAANPPVGFSMGTDSTGLMAALGINTFFQGTNATNISVNTEVHSNLNRICAGAVNGANEANPGDNTMANAIGKLLNKPVTISTLWKTTGNQSLSEYYSGLVATVGADTRSAKTNRDYNTALAQDLDERQASISGVNIDEEMAQLIKFQSSYTAAAKLITTADQMMQTLLGLKQ